MSRRLPALSFREVVRALERLGFQIDHVTGSHYRLKHTQDPGRSTVVPRHSRDIKTRRSAIDHQASGGDRRRVPRRAVSLGPLCAEMCATKALLGGDGDVISDIYRERVVAGAAPAPGAGAPHIS